MRRGEGSDEGEWWGKSGEWWGKSASGVRWSSKGEG